MNKNLNMNISKNINKVFNKKGNFNFMFRMILHSFIPDILSALIIVFYGIISTQSFAQAKLVLKPIILIILVMQFITVPLICVIAYNGISEHIFNFYNAETSKKERTLLLESLMSYPYICALITFVYFAIGSIVLYRFWGTTDMSQNIRYLNLIEYFCGAYIAAIFGHKYTMNICTEVAEDIVDAGLDYEYVMHKKTFGSSMFSQMLLYIIIPLILSCVINCSIVFAEYKGFFSKQILPEFMTKTQRYRMFLTCGFNVCLQLFLTFLFYRSYSKNTKRMTECLEKIKNKELSSNEVFKTAITDEFEYSLYLSNRMIEMFRKILEQSSTVGNTIKNTTSDFIQLSNESSSVSIEQSAATHELSRTMESVRNLSHIIESKIEEVSDLANNTSEDVKKCSKILSKNIDKMSEIVKANNNTIDGISNLNEKISNIWEILKLINGIADQTKIIAFNAELEASRTSTKNKNFKNIANEIRQLANNVVANTKDIREKTLAIKLSSDNLVQTSQNCSKLIDDGKNFIFGLNDSLKEINQSAINNANNSKEIKEKAITQTEAFENIANTINEISKTVQTYAVSTQTISDTAEALFLNTEELEETTKIFRGTENE